VSAASSSTSAAPGLLNRTQYPSDVIALVVLWRLRYRLTLRDLSEMFLQRGIVFSHEAVRDWEAKLAPAWPANSGGAGAAGAAPAAAHCMSTKPSTTLALQGTL
jgi:transposase